MIHDILVTYAYTVMIKHIVVLKAFPPKRVEFDLMCLKILPRRELKNQLYSTRIEAEALEAESATQRSS